MTCIRSWKESTKRVLHCLHLQKTSEAWCSLGINRTEEVQGKDEETELQEYEDSGQPETDIWFQPASKTAQCKLLTSETTENSLMSIICLWPVEMLLTLSYCQERFLTSSHFPPSLPHFTTLLISFSWNSGMCFLQDELRTSSLARWPFSGQRKSYLRINKFLTSIQLMSSAIGSKGKSNAYCIAMCNPFHLWISLKGCSKIRHI